MSALHDAITAAGGQTKFAEQIGVTVQAIRKWLDNRVPAERVLQIYKSTGGAVTPHQMRPDIYPDADYLPALDELPAEADADASV